MTALLDLNLLIALAWPNHIHHERAQAWFRRLGSQAWATCPLTESGFVRISSNRAVFPDARNPAEARALLRRIAALPHHEFWSDDIAFSSSTLVDDGRLRGHVQVTDAHLLALALRHRGRLATLDRGVLDLVPARHQPSDVIWMVEA